MKIVHFRTVPNGAYKWMKSHMRRGYWRVLEVIDPKGSRNIRSKNVQGVVWEGPEGIDGVTPRSAYYIGDSMEQAHEEASK